VGKEMRRRHGLLANFLTEILKVDPATADEEACRMEHSLSIDTLERLTDADSVARQQREIELQQNLVALALRSCPRTGGLSALAADCPLRSREKRLREAIQEAIEVLESTRRAFKSKQLEMLRKNLTAVLIETD
jgi:hypothetical protein